MSYAEEIGVNELKKFVESAKEKGICFNGEDIDSFISTVVINIVEDYISEVIADGNL